MERRCVGCRKTDTPERMERFVFVDDFGLIFDLRGKAPGRGAYVHPDPGCLKSALEGGFAQSFKHGVNAEQDVPTFITEVIDSIRSRLDENLRVAMRAGRLAVGGNDLADGMKRDDVDVVLIANDCGSATDRKYRSNAQRKEIPVLDGLSGEALARPLGKSFVGVLGVSQASAFSLQRDWVALTRLGYFGSGVEEPPEHG